AIVAPVPALQAPPRLSLELLLQRVEEAPVSALADDLLGAALDYPHLVQAQSDEAHRILRVIFTPAVIGNILHHLEDIVVVWRESLVHDRLGGPFRLEGADVRRLQHGTEHSLGGDRMPLDKLPVSEYQAAEVLEPGSVGPGIDHHVSD